jgi:hypothetical protein
MSDETDDFKTMPEDSRAGDGRAVHSWTGKIFGRFLWRDETMGKDEGKSLDKKDPGAFDHKFDFETRRVSFSDGFLDHYSQNLGFIYGVLDMIFQIADAGRLGEVDGGGLEWVIQEAEARVKELEKNLGK